MSNEIPNHEYDGIRELDNPLPGWWLLTFYATIVFAGIYYAHYEILGTGPTTAQELAADLAQHKASSPAAGETPSGDEEATLQALVGDEQALLAGRGEYQVKCAACHGPQGGGLIGPNLTDNHWLHGEGKITEIRHTIMTGVTDKGMPAWENLIAKELINKVAAYVYSLKGTNPPGAKAAEGTPY